MNLKMMELYGFKSFADRTVLRFDHGITGVVGPNGSGKSNIADALRWVMGEQSARLLRGHSMEDVIFNGTEKRRSLVYCEVSLLFDNSDGTWPDYGSEISLTRRYYRSGESEYLLNRKPCRLKTVVDLFRDSGLGRQGYAIIGQGQVEDILSNRAEDRRNVFHEAAGIMRYRARRDEAQRRLDASSENLTRLKDIMGVLEARLEPLARQSADAREYLRLSGELKVLDINRFILRYREINDGLTSLEGEFAAASDVLAQLKDDLGTEKGKILLRQEDLARDEAGVEELRARFVDMTREESRLSGILELDRQKIVMLHEEARRSLERIRSAKTELAEVTEALDAAHGQSEKIEARLPEERAVLTDAESKEEEARQAGEKAEELLESTKQAYIDSITSEGSLTGERVRLETMLSSLEEKKKDLAQRSRECEERERILLEERERLSAEGRELSQAMSLKKDEVQKVFTARELLRKEQDTLRKEASDTRDRLQATLTREKMLRAMKRDYEGYNNTVRQLLTDARNNRELAARIDSVVAEVIRVPAQYTVAIESVLGGSLQNIITANEEDAKYAIEYLRSHQYGRTTFLPLSTVRGRGITREQEAALKIEGCLGLASELVSFNEKYRGIVESLLGRTAVAKNMDAAILMARAASQTLRIVTLQGDTIQAGGAITGGSIRSQYTSILTREKDIETCTETAKRLQRESDAYRDREEDASGRASAMEERARTLQDEYRSLSVKKAGIDTRLQQVADNAARNQKTKEEISAREEALQETRRNIEDGIRENRERVERMAQAHSVQREEADRLAEKAEAADAAYEAAKSVTLQVRETLRRDEMELESVRREIAGLEERQSGIRERVTAEERAREERETEAELLQKGLLEREEELRRAKNAAQKAEEEIARTEARNARNRDEIATAENVLREREKDELRLEAELEQKRFKKEQLTTELTALSNRIWDAYELTYANALPFADPAFDAEGSEKKAESLRRKIRALGQVNVRAVEDYTACREELEGYQGQWEDLIRSRSELEKMIRDLTAEMSTRYLENLEKINVSFANIFSRLFGGGTAKLSLEDPMNPLESGIEIRVQPPGKRLQLLSLLSGGEKAMTAIALLFAMLDLQPSPFCVLDEIEAALDEPNIIQFTDFLREYARNTQFIVITHRKTTMESADTLYGITMQEKGVSNVVSVRMSDLVKEEPHE